MSERAKASAKSPYTKINDSISQEYNAKYSESLDSSAKSMLLLQRTIGNQAVQRLIHSGNIQAKLKIGKPNDKYEQEADRLAEQIMRMPDPIVQRQTEEEEKEEEIKEEEKILQPKTHAGQTSEVTPDLESRIQSLKGGGQPLPESSRDFFEPRFGRDLSKVQVHTDAKAAGMAQALEAQAFTVGRHMVFSAGQYAPSTSSGRMLMAHELAHLFHQGILQREHINNHLPAPVVNQSQAFITAKRPPTYREELEREKIKVLSPKSVSDLKIMIADPSKRQLAIDKVIKESDLNFPSSIYHGKVVYVADLEEKCKKRKSTEPEKKKCEDLKGQTSEILVSGVGIKILVEIGPKAFNSVSELYSTLYHEYVHVKQAMSFSRGPAKDAKEVEAYYFELKRSGITGIAENIIEVIGLFGNLRKYYLKLRGDEKIKYKKDYDESSKITLGLLMKHIHAAKTSAELALVLQLARDFLRDVKSELGSADKNKLTETLQKQNKRLFLLEIDRISKMRKAPDFALDWYNLKESYLKLSGGDRKMLLTKYEIALKRLFNLLVDSILKLKSKGPGLFGALELSNKERALRELWKDLDVSPSLKSRLKRNYEKALR